MAIKHIIKNKNGNKIEVNLTPMKGIRFFCLECVGYHTNDVKNCTSINCALYPFRLGKVVSGRKGNTNSTGTQALKKWREKNLLNSINKKDDLNNE